MKLRDSRILALVIAVAFLVLWCVSVNVIGGAQPQEPLPDPLPAAPSPQVQMIGVAGWCLVGAGISGVVAAVLLDDKKRRRRRSSRGTGSLRGRRRAVQYRQEPVRKRYRSL